MTKELFDAQKKIDELTKRETMVLELADQQEKVKLNYSKQLNNKNLEIEALNKELINVKELLQEYQCKIQ